jgi:DNA (cytosine-5)-methyltransferase 1
MGLNGAFSDRHASARGVGHGDSNGPREAVDSLPGSLVGADGSGVRPGPTNGFWRNADWLQCTDGGWRPVEPGTFPLDHGVSARVGRLRGYGNAIVVPQASEFCAAVMEAVS